MQYPCRYWICHAPVHRASGGPAAAGAVSRAVAEIPATGADPVFILVGLIDILAVPHEEAVPAQLAKQRLAA